MTPLGIGLAFFIMIGALTDIAERIGLFRVPLLAAWRRATGLPRSVWGTALAHFGIAVTLLGIVGVSTWASELIVAIKPKQTVSPSGYEPAFEGASFSGPGPIIANLLRDLLCVRGAFRSPPWSRPNAVSRPARLQLRRRRY